MSLGESLVLTAPQRIAHTTNLFALGYFLFYVPYSALAKLLTSGHLSTTGGLSGVTALPLSLFATAVALALFVLVMRWRSPTIRRGVGLAAIRGRPLLALSGIATALIVATTTVCYSFDGISILFALLLMRGGVLLMAPLFDLWTRHRIATSTAAAFATTLIAFAIALMDSGSYVLTLAALINLSLYLLGYALRLGTMVRLGKGPQTSDRLCYLLNEVLVAAPIFVLVPAAGALLGVEELRQGYRLLAHPDAALAAVAIGLSYAGLLICGSLVYLDPRGTTLPVLLNRASSLLAGILAAGLVPLLAPLPSMHPSHLAAAAVLLLSLHLAGRPGRARA